MCLLLVLGVKLLMLSVSLSGVSVPEGLDSEPIGIVLPRRRAVGGVPGVGLLFSRGPKSVGLGARRVGEPPADSDFVGREVARDIGVPNLDVLLVICATGAPVTGVPSTNRIAEGTVVYVKFRVEAAMLEAGDIGIGGRPALTQGRIV